MSDKNTSEQQTQSTQQDTAAEQQTEQAQANASAQPEQLGEQGDQEQQTQLQQRVAELELALSKAEAKLTEQKDSVLRAAAESENVRRRAAQDVEKAQKFALEKFAAELLSTVDNLERALQLAQTSDDVSTNFVEGIELTHKGLVATLEKFGVAAVGEEGEAFNPDLHQAMSMQESKEHANNSVMAVMQRGYQLNGRLLRPAMVMVARNSGGVDTEA